MKSEGEQSESTFMDMGISFQMPSGRWGSFMSPNNSNTEISRTSTFSFSEIIYLQMFIGLLNNVFIVL